MPAPSDTPDTSDLSPQHAAFVDAYCGECRFNASASYRAAGYRATGKSLRVSASRLLASPSIRAAVDERLDNLSPTAGEVLARITEHAGADIGDFIEIDDEGEQALSWMRKLRPLIDDLKRAEGGDEIEGAEVNGDQESPRESVIRLNREIQKHLSDMPCASPWRLNLAKAQQAGKLHLIKRIGYDRNGNPTLTLVDSQAALVQLGRARKLFVDRTEINDPTRSPMPFADALAKVYSDDAGE